MIRYITTSALLIVCLAAAAPAQSLTGRYKLEGRPNVDILVVPIPFTNAYVGQVYVNGVRADEETFVAVPAGENVFKTVNERGNEGQLTQKADGDVEAEITSGPNAGKKTTWLKQ